MIGMPISSRNRRKENAQRYRRPHKRMRFVHEGCGLSLNKMPQLREAILHSQEALLLGYEEALTRRDEIPANISQLQRICYGSAIGQKFK